MTKHEMVVSVLQSLGLKPQIDDEGDIFVRYQMKTFYVMGANSDDEDYLVVVFPQMYEVDEGKRQKSSQPATRQLVKSSSPRLY